MNKKFERPQCLLWGKDSAMKNKSEKDLPIERVGELELMISGLAGTPEDSPAIYCRVRVEQYGSPEGISENSLAVHRQGEVEPSL